MWAGFGYARHRLPWGLYLGTFFFLCIQKQNNFNNIIFFWRGEPKGNVKKKNTVDFLWAACATLPPTSLFHLCVCVCRKFSFKTRVAFFFLFHDKKKRVCIKKKKKKCFHLGSLCVVCVCVCVCKKKNGWRWQTSTKKAERGMSSKISNLRKKKNLWCALTWRGDRIFF